jgi:hypothetical protein
MATSSTKPATKKTFHFPKSDKAVEVQPAPVKKVKASAKKVPAEKAKVTASAAPLQEEKQKRVKKEKVIRDSFTMPESDYARLATLKQKCASAGVAIKKSELLRAGLIMLESASDKNLLAAVKSVETIKTGRPAKS